MKKLIIDPDYFSPAFVDYLFSAFRYEVYYGGRGSGKSKFKAQKRILKCIKNRYYKGVFVRKHFASIRDSSFALLKDTIEEFGLQDAFVIHKSTMRIECRNGNVLIPKGIDDDQKVKSITDPTDLWVEEANELSFEDFVTLDKGLRTKKAPLQTTIGFNPVVKTHWLREHFFDPNDGHEPHPKFGDKLMIHRSTFRDNPFIDQDEYYQVLLNGAAGNINKIRVDINGDWGLLENNDPWLHAFDRNKLVKPLKFMPSFDVYLSFDFNREPVSCLAMQMSPNLTTTNSFIHYIKEISGEIQLEELCQRIKQIFPFSILHVTGDASGRSGDIGFNARHSTYYTMIKQYLELTDAQMDINTKNLEHHDSRALCNTLLYACPHIFFDPSCETLINDCEIAMVDDKGVTPGKLKKDRDTYKMDMFDAWRYSVQTYFKELVESVYLKKPSIIRI